MKSTKPARPTPAGRREERGKEEPAWLAAWLSPDEWPVEFSVENSRSSSQARTGAHGQWIVGGISSMNDPHLRTSGLDPVN
jgi:hypothetical protein